MTTQESLKIALEMAASDFRLLIEGVLQAALKSGLRFSWTAELDRSNHESATITLQIHPQPPIGGVKLKNLGVEQLDLGADNIEDKATGFVPRPRSEFEHHLNEARKANDRHK